MRPGPLPSFVDTNFSWRISWNKLKNSKEPPLARKVEINLAEVGISGRNKKEKVGKFGFGNELGLGGSAQAHI